MLQELLYIITVLTLENLRGKTHTGSQGANNDPLIRSYFGI
jgi:hypothetical protein